MSHTSWSAETPFTLAAASAISSFLTRREKSQLWQQGHRPQVVPQRALHCTILLRESKHFCGCSASGSGCALAPFLRGLSSAWMSPAMDSSYAAAKLGALFPGSDLQHLAELGAIAAKALQPSQALTPAVPFQLCLRGISYPGSWWPPGRRVASPWASAPSGPALPPPPSVPHRWVHAEASVPPLLSASPWGPWGRTERSSRGSSRGTASRGPAATRSFLAPEAPFGGTQRVFPNHCMPHSGHPGRAASPRPWRPGPELRRWAQQRDPRLPAAKSPVPRRLRQLLARPRAPKLQVGLDLLEELAHSDGAGTRTHTGTLPAAPTLHFRSAHVTAPGRGRGHHRTPAALSRRLCARSSRLWRSPRANRGSLAPTRIQ